MSLTIKREQPKPIPEGSHVAICYSIVDVGLQEYFLNSKVTLKPQIYFTFEIPKLRIEKEFDGEVKSQPMSISRRFNVALGELSHLQPALEGLLGRSLTLEEKDGGIIY